MEEVDLDSIHNATIEIQLPVYKATITLQAGTGISVIQPSC